MKFPHHFLLAGAILGSVILALFGYIVTAGASSLTSSSPDASSPVSASLSPEPINQVDAPPAPLSSARTSGKPASQNPVTYEGCEVSAKFPDSILQWCELITAYASQHKLEPNLIASMMLQESGGDPLAFSSSGAVGLLQVMPRDGIAANFWCINGPCFSSRPTIAELQDPEFNIEFGTRMISGLITKTGSIRDGLKSYGPKDVGYYYADIVLAIYENYQ